MGVSVECGSCKAVNGLRNRICYRCGKRALFMASLFRSVSPADILPGFHQLGST